jgi:glucose 1-dehydrogenase
MQEAQGVAEELKIFGYESIAIEADISKESECARLIEDTVKKFGRIDVLVNNAGIQDDVPFTDVTLDERFKIIVLI